MREKILEICKELCCKEVSEEEQLIAVGLLNSFRLMELICKLEEEFHITFQPEEISNLEMFSSVNSISEAVKSKVSEGERW